MPQGHEPPAADADHEELGDKVVAEYHPVMLGNHGDADQKCGIEADQRAHLFEGEGGQGPVEGEEQAAMVSMTVSMML